MGSRYPDTESRQGAEGNACMGWVMEQGSGRTGHGGFGAPPGARLFPRQRCPSAAAAHTAGTQSRKGNRENKPSSSLLSTARSSSVRGEVTGRNKAKAQAWTRL